MAQKMRGKRKELEGYQWQERAREGIVSEGN